MGKDIGKRGVMMETKICSKCGIDKPISAFQKISWPRQGEEIIFYTSKCKTCTNTCRKNNKLNYIKHPRVVIDATSFNNFMLKNNISINYIACILKCSSRTVYRWKKLGIPINKLLCLSKYIS